MQSQGPYHNLQQLSDAVMRLEAAGDSEATNAASFLVSQVQPLTTAIAELKAAVADLQTKLAAIVGAPKP